MKFGKNAKNRPKLKEKAEILSQENFQKRGNHLKSGTLTPLLIRSNAPHNTILQSPINTIIIETNCGIVTSLG